MKQKNEEPTVTLKVPVSLHTDLKSRASALRKGLSEYTVELLQGKSVLEALTGLPQPPTGAENIKNPAEESGINRASVKIPQLGELTADEAVFLGKCLSNYRTGDISSASTLTQLRDIAGRMANTAKTLATVASTLQGIAVQSGMEADSGGKGDNIRDRFAEEAAANDREFDRFAKDVAKAKPTLKSSRKRRDRRLSGGAA